MVELVKSNGHLDKVTVFHVSLPWDEYVHKIHNINSFRIRRSEIRRSTGAAVGTGAGAWVG